MSKVKKKVHLIGSASGMAASQDGCKEGPTTLQQSPYFIEFAHDWQAMLIANTPAKKEEVLPALIQHSERLANEVAALVKQKQFFTVFGGDHSCAIGTWSGAASALAGDMGLIWVDAHMDSHTPETSFTGNLHGMPLATLLGHGHPGLTNILTRQPKIKAERVCLIGVRSYEPGEAALLKKLNVRIFFIEEVKARGLEAVMQEAVNIVKQNTVGFGITVDIDSVDPTEAPGTGVQEPDGLSAKELCQVLQHLIAPDPQLIGAEIVEFDPKQDKNNLTEKLCKDLLTSVCL